MPGYGAPLADYTIGSTLITGCAAPAEPTHPIAASLAWGAATSAAPSDDATVAFPTAATANTSAERSIPRKHVLTSCAEWGSVPLQPPPRSPPRPLPLLLHFSATPLTARTLSRRVNGGARLVHRSGDDCWASRHIKPWHLSNPVRRALPPYYLLLSRIGGHDASVATTLSPHVHPLSWGNLSARHARRAPSAAASTVGWIDDAIIEDDGRPTVGYDPERARRLLALRSSPFHAFRTSPLVRRFTCGTHNLVNRHWVLRRNRPNERLSAHLHITTEQLWKPRLVGFDIHIRLFKPIPAQWFPDSGIHNCFLRPASMMAMPADSVVGRAGFSHREAAERTVGQ